MFTTTQPKVSSKSNDITSSSLSQDTAFSKIEIPSSVVPLLVKSEDAPQTFQTMDDMYQNIFVGQLAKNKISLPKIKKQSIDQNL